jgi:hypothetical protein
MGIVELPYPDELTEELIASGDLLLVQGDPALPNSVVLMTEQATNLNFDNHNITLDVGDKSEFSLELLTRGAQPGKPATVTLTLESVVPPPVNDDPRNQEMIVGMVKLPESVQTGPDGKVTFEIEALSPGICRILFSADGLLPVPANDNRLIHLWQFYFYVRVLPKDDYPEDVITNEFLRDNWQFVYDNLFIYYDLLFPTMTRIIDWSNPAAIRGNATLIKVFTDPNGIDNTLYMPISRDMSRGKRQLLFRYCSLAENGLV